MTSHRMKNGPDTTKLYKAAELRLYDYLLPSQTATGDGLPTVVRDYILDVIGCKRKTYRYMMFVGLLVAVTDKSLHPRCLQLQSGCEGAYDPRSLCKDVVSPFEKKILKGRLGGSCDPYVSNPARHPMIEKTNKTKSASDKVILGKLYDVLEFVRTADDALRRKMFCYAIKAIKGIDLSKTKVPPFMRRITVSEAAALQGFPKDFVFCGSQSDKYKQIGNSVPPPFASAIAREVMSCL